MPTLSRTPRTLLKGSLRLLGVGGEDEDLTATMLNDALEMMNEWLATQDHTFNHVISRQSFPLATNTFSYQIGDGATWDTDRPNQILAAVMRIANGDYTIEITSRQRWNEVFDKTVRGHPTCLYYQPDYPNGKVLFDRIPSEAATVYLDLELPIAEVLTLDTSISLPPEYASAIRYNMAISLAPEYEKDVPNAVAVRAEQAMETIMRRNVANDLIELDFYSMWQPNAEYGIDNIGAGSGSSAVIVLDGDGNEFIV